MAYLEMMFLSLKLTEGISSGFLHWHGYLSLHGELWCRSSSLPGRAKAVRLRRCGSGAVAPALCCVRAAARAQAEELRSSGCCQPRLSLLTRVGELEPRFRFILWADSIRGVFLLWLLFQNRG